MARKAKTVGIKAETSAKVKAASPTSIAAKVSGSVGRTRSGRDSITRVKSPIKVVDTNARQWNRYTP